MSRNCPAALAAFAGWVRAPVTSIAAVAFAGVFGVVAGAVVVVIGWLERKRGWLRRRRRRRQQQRQQQQC